MTRRCSHCSNNGHNFRTCPTRGSGTCGGLGGSSSSAVKLFGVRLTDGSIIKKSASMGNLSALAVHHRVSPSFPLATGIHSDSPLSDHARYSNQDNEGYLSDDPARGFGPIHHRVERKRGVPWTEEEHRLFLVGGSSEASRRKRRSSLFDMVTDSSPTQEDTSSPSKELKNKTYLPSLELSLNNTTESEVVTATAPPPQGELVEAIEPSNGLSPMLVPGGYFPPCFPVTCTIWLPASSTSLQGTGIPWKLRLLVSSVRHETETSHSPCPLSLKLIGEPSRPFAFHSNGSVNSSDLSKGNSAIQAI
ncbi:hypothetical protein F2Q69_00003580 [Brassica cretica]|uniref:Uncharacterized protein n=1 Tax=Brassica cretica TaxID=69181 RepID=A0A8S9NX11_BRACR|nr:hypothetical protein F2Q69_00003580 [Brassica cretica]